MFSFFSISLSAPRSECINTYTLSTIRLVVLPWNWNLCSLDGDVCQEAYCSYTSYNRSKNHCIALTPLVFKAFSVFLVCSSSHGVCFFYLATCKWNAFDTAILVFMKSIAHKLSTLQKVHKTTDFPFLIRAVCRHAAAETRAGESVSRCNTRGYNNIYVKAAFSYILET